MPQHFSLVGQHPQSMDCGFFSGYVLSQYENVGYPGLPNLSLSAQAVYDARAAFYQEFFRGNPPSDKMTNGPHSRQISNGLEVSQVTPYLNGLNSPGYRVDSGPAKKAEDIRAMLHRHLASPPNFACIMVCLDSLIAAHWITILYRSETPQQGSQAPASGGTPAGALPTLKWGSKSEVVAMLQGALNAAGKSFLPRLVEDGIFGQNTYNRVREYQRSQAGLAEDGVVGPNTWGRLKPNYQSSGAARSGAIATNTGASYYYGIYNPGLLGKQFFASEMTEDDLLDDLVTGGINYVAWRYRA